jgi:NAD(P)-dependent dehydrogenase (short-subunit alcohol dehydrogenase family)
VESLGGTRVLVLGAASGIGFCAADAAVEHGAQVTLSNSQSAAIVSIPSASTFSGAPGETKLDKTAEQAAIDGSGRV